MLKKIIKLQNVGRFKNSVAAQALARHTLVFGANGSGKSTLCAILRSLQSGDASYILGRTTLGATGRPACDLLFESGAAKFADGRWSAAVPNIAVFDSTFVSENVHSGEAVELGQKRNLYRVIIGKEGSDLAKEEERLGNAIREKTSAFHVAEKSLRALVPTGAAFADFQSMTLEEDIDAKIAGQKATVEVVREAGAIQKHAELSELVLPQLPARLSEVLGKTIERVAEDAERIVSAHLASHRLKAGQAWLTQGLEYLTDHGFPFCGQPLDNVTLIAAYRAIFSEQYTSLKVEVQALGSELDALIGERSLGGLSTTIESNRGSLEYWGRYCTLDANALKSPDRVTEVARGIRGCALTLIGLKAGAPLEQVTPDDAFRAALREYDDTRGAVGRYNLAVQAANQQIRAKKALAVSIDPAAAQAALQRLELNKKRHEPTTASAVAEFERCGREKADLEKQKDTVRKRLGEHTAKVVKPYEAKINALLEDFNAGFKIAKTDYAYPGGVATSTYNLVIEQTHVNVGDERTPLGQPSFKNTLSGGDRSTLALAFFLAHLELTPDPSRIVVFDDPFSSQDAFRRQQTVYEVAKVAQSNAQILVLSHDSRFLAQVWRRLPTDARASLQVVDHRALGSKLSPCDIENACKGRAASELDDLRAYHSNGAGQPRDVVKKMRIVLETFLRSTYSGDFDPDDNLGEMVGKIRRTGDLHSAWSRFEELDQINDYTIEHHHGEDPTDSSEDPINASELAGFVRRTLFMVNNLQA